MLRDRIVGVILGLVTLATAFLLPFYNIPATAKGVSGTVYGYAVNLYTNLGGIQSTGTSNQLALAYVFILAAVLIIIAGAVGYFPLGSAALGLVAMVSVTLEPYVVGIGVSFSTLAVGYYIVWVTSILELGAALWFRSGMKRMGGAQQLVVSQPAPQPSPSN